MDKSVKINLAGYLFQLDQDAYYHLRDYLKSVETRLRNSPDQTETMDDIERRIAEIFQTMGGSAGVITLENVRSVIGIIGQPSDFETTGSPVGYTPPMESPGYFRKEPGNSARVFGEIFGTIGTILFVIFRIFAIIFGIVFVITGFAAMIAFLLVLFVKDPGIFSAGVHGNFFYLPDFLNFVVNPSLNTWICILLSLVVILPLLALIYWGIKLIFWFRSRIGVFSLVAFVIWAISLTALAIILAGQGLTFAERGRASSTIIIQTPPDTLFVITGRKLSDLKYDRELRIPEDSYSLYANTESMSLSIKPRFEIISSGDRTARIEINKWSAGEVTSEASRRARSLPYGCSYTKDTLYLDEYFTLPENHRWSGDEIKTKVFIPDNTIVWMDQSAWNLFNWGNHPGAEEHAWEPADNFLIMTHEGLITTSKLRPVK